MDASLIMLPSHPEFTQWLSLPPPGAFCRDKELTILAANPDSQVIEEISMALLDERIEDLGIYY
jgi:hypothetical protein